MPDIAKIASVLGAGTVSKIYNDGVRGPAKEMSRLVWTLLSIQAFYGSGSAGIGIPGSFGNLEKVRENVKEVNQMDAPTSIAGPVMDRIKYLEEGNYLTYLNLLSRAIDREQVNEPILRFSI
jgi:hypothetical protein